MIVLYVGKELVEARHFDIYNSFIETGMGNLILVLQKLNQY